MRSALLAVWLLAASGLAGCSASEAPTTNATALAGTSVAEECGQELSQQQLIEIVKAAIRIAGGDPSLLDVTYEISTVKQGCDYLVSAVSSTTTNHYSLVIGRSGEVKSWPWCCEPGLFVPPPKETRPHQGSG